MNRVLIDTDIISYYLKGVDEVIKNVELYFKYFDKLEISIITYYEITSGLRAKNAFKKLDIFDQFIQKNIVLPLTEESANISAKIYGKLRQSGKTLDDIDLLIAGIAISNELTLVTNNQKHFDRIQGLKTENWKNNIL